MIQTPTQSSVPTHYTNVDGGQWIEWDFLLAPTFTYLAAIQRMKCTKIQWYGKPIVSIAYHDPIGMNNGEFARWDCTNGWTTTIEDVETTTNDL